MKEKKNIEARQIKWAVSAGAGPFDTSSWATYERIYNPIGKANQTMTPQ